MTRIIWNADDIGYSEAVSLGIIKAHRDGLIKSTTMMTNMEAAPFAARLLKDHPGLYCGQHTNIVVGRSVANPALLPSLVDEKGYFNVKERLKRGLKLNVEEIKIEVRAQAARFQELMGHAPTHIEGHAVQDPGLKQAIREVATEMGVHYTDSEIVWIDGKPVEVIDQHHSGYEVPVRPKVMYYQDTVSVDYWLKDVAGLLQEDLVEMHTHPGYVDQTLLTLSSYHIPRAKEVAIACDPRVRWWADDHHVEFITFEDIRKI